tara:strand:- start:1678 stop:1788 length:111 start_codon:yes stop_codon:yes gene_type:complete
MNMEKAAQLAWNTVVGVTFLAVLGVVMTANHLVKKQ